MNGFEKFIHKRLQAYGEPALTITHAGIININLTAMNKHVGDNTYGTLYYDAGSSLIGIKFSTKKTPEAYKIIKYRKGKFGTISGRAFLKYYKIKHKDKTRNYLAEWNEQEQMLVIDLKKHQKPQEKKEDDEDISSF